MKAQPSISPLLRITKNADVALALLLVTVIAVMILQLPLWLIDTLLAINLSISMGLLLVTLYIPTALSLSTFPSLLLFTTLFRLSVNIATSRQILLNANAGHIIDTFGNLVVSGNFVVGAVIFLIITIVQFMVITKGAERVAEVAARFTLDAMPGKQMSIDADLRAGTLDMKSARKKRSELEQESQLFGAMDGAMKFVKGDAIAGLIIAAVNILGGLAIGILQKGMAADKALQTYSILTIGDGLVSQIPALLISIAAGIVVTRVNNPDESNLGSQIGGQLLANPKAIILCSFIIFAFALVPGFPKLQFIILGTVAAATGFSLKNAARPVLSDDPSNPEAAEPGVVTTSWVKLTRPLSVNFSRSLAALIDLAEIRTTLDSCRKELMMELGVPYPQIIVDFSNAAPARSCILCLHESPLAIIGLPFGLGDLSKDPSETIIDNTEGSIRKSLQGNDNNTQIGAVSAMQTKDAAYKELSNSVKKILRKFAAEFIGVQETKELLDHSEAQFSTLVRELGRLQPIPRLTEVLKRLVQEEISIRNFRSILETLVEWSPREKDVVLLTEYVRTSLSRQISHKFGGDEALIKAHIIDPRTEETIRGCIKHTPTGSYLALPSEQSKLLANQVKELARLSATTVIITSMDIRRYVRKFLEDEAVDIPVLSFQEISPEVKVQTLSRISFNLDS